MAEPWQLLELNHINLVVDGYDETVAHLRDRLGFALQREMHDWDASTDACLMVFGDTMLELFAPKPGSDSGYGLLLSRYGDRFSGIQYQVPDLSVARELLAAQDVPVTIDLGVAFFTDPTASFGVEWEIYDKAMARDPGASYWADEHPMRLTGCDHVTVVVADVQVATARLLELTNATPAGPVRHATAASEGVRLRVGSIDWEVVQPTGVGPVAEHLERYGEGLRSTVWRSSDLDAATAYLRAQGFDVVPGDADGTVAVPPAQNRNLLFEFTGSRVAPAVPQPRMHRGFGGSGPRSRPR
jgi:catechol 2,3-dioxygenase-like lactoylglutathione lyase family enzyme